VRIRIGAKLVLSFLVILVLMAVVGGVSLYKINVINEHADEVSEDWLKSTENIGHLHILMERYRAHVLEVLLAENAGQMEDLGKIVLQMESVHTDYEKNLSSGNHSQEEIKAFEQFDRSWEEYLKIVELGIDMANQGKSLEAHRILKQEGDQKFNDTAGLLEKLTQLSDQKEIGRAHV